MEILITIALIAAFVAIVVYKKRNKNPDAIPARSRTADIEYRNINEPDETPR